MRLTPSQLLKFTEVSALLVTDLTNIRYLTGLSVSAGCLLITPKAFRLYVDSRYAEMAKSSAKHPVKVCDHAKLEKDMLKIPKCGFEERKVTVSVFRTWKTRFKSTAFIRTENAVEHFRRQKDRVETKLMKTAKRITEDMFDAVPDLLEIGISEKRLAWALEALARSLGADGFSFDPIVAFGPNSSRPHHRVSERKLKKNDIVQLDIGVMYKGYASDLSRVFFTGMPTKQQVKALRAVAEARDAAMKVAKEGISAKDLDTVARSVLKKHGLDAYFTHALGHGVGLEVHEGITISARDPRGLLKGEVITIEPGVYFPGKFGIRLEDMVFIR